jgi:hypothetical protein
MAIFRAVSTRMRRAVGTVFGALSVSGTIVGTGRRNDRGRYATRGESAADGTSTGYGIDARSVGEAGAGGRGTPKAIETDGGVCRKTRVALGDVKGSTFRKRNSNCNVTGGSGNTRVGIALAGVVDAISLSAAIGGVVVARRRRRWRRWRWGGSGCWRRGWGRGEVRRWWGRWGSWRRCGSRSGEGYQTTVC